MIDIRELRIGNIVNDDTNLSQEVGCKIVGIVKFISEENIELKYLRSDGDTFYGDEYPRNLSPIRLTEELLLKCGFKFENSIMAYTRSDIGIGLALEQKYKDRFDLSDDFSIFRKEKSWEERLEIARKRFENGEGLSIIETEYCESIYPAIKIKHLHQLQNLYFDLTGEELEVAL